MVMDKSQFIQSAETGLPLALPEPETKSYEKDFLVTIKWTSDTAPIKITLKDMFDEFIWDLGIRSYSFNKIYGEFEKGITFSQFEWAQFSRDISDSAVRSSAQTEVGMDIVLQGFSDDDLNKIKINFNVFAKKFRPTKWSGAGFKYFANYNKHTNTNTNWTFASTESLFDERWGFLMNLKEVNYHLVDGDQVIRMVFAMKDNNLISLDEKKLSISSSDYITSTDSEKSKQWRLEGVVTNRSNQNPVLQNVYITDAVDTEWTVAVICRGAGFQSQTGYTSGFEQIKLPLEMQQEILTASQLTQDVAISSFLPETFSLSRVSQDANGYVLSSNATLSGRGISAIIVREVREF